MIYLAGMQTIDPALYEAAAIDGASRWKQFRYVTLPGLRPTILFTIVVSTIGAAQLFGEPLLYDPTHQPGGGTANQYQTLGPADVPAGLDATTISGWRRPRPGRCS